MVDAFMRFQSYEQMIKTYDLGMYYERKKDYKKALKTVPIIHTPVVFVTARATWRRTPKWVATVATT